MLPLLAKNLAVLAVVGGSMALALGVLQWQERLVSRFVAHRLGWRGVLLTAWVGVPLHEVSHLIAAWLSGHRIVSWRLFEPDPVTGTLGYVRHRHTKQTLRQHVGYALIGLAPAVMGLGALTLCVAWMVSPAKLIAVIRQSLSQGASADAVVFLWPFELLYRICTEIWRQKTWLLPLQLYLAACIACHMAPSRADWRSAFRGNVVVIVIAVGVVGMLSVLKQSVQGLLLLIPLLVFAVLLVWLCQAVYIGGIGVWERLVK